LIEHLRDLREAGQADPQRLAAAVCNLAINKYDLFLSPELLAADYAARELDTVAAHAYLCGLPDLGAS
jgi:hypothetical protein